MKKVIIIAEAGVNHNGNLEQALELCRVAKNSGADYVKFQTFKAEALTTKKAKQAIYQTQNLGNETSQQEMLKKLELSRDDHLIIKKYCTEIGIGFFSTAFDNESVNFLNSLGMKLWKIPSGELTNLPYIEKIISFGYPIILSTGMATMDEIGQVIGLFEKQKFPLKNLTILHCTTDYPAKMSDINLHAMNSIKATYGINVGYSDHSLGIEIPIAAVALGAAVIEKHFTLDRNLPGPDHKASLEPEELKKMVEAIRNIEIALGSFDKKPTERELENRIVARKSIVAATDIKKGDLFSEINLTTKRPGTGINPMKWHEIIGTKATKDYKADDLI